MVQLDCPLENCTVLITMLLSSRHCTTFGPCLVFYSFKVNVRACVWCLRSYGLEAGGALEMVATCLLKRVGGFFHDWLLNVFLMQRWHSGCWQFISTCLDGSLIITCLHWNVAGSSVYFSKYFQEAKPISSTIKQQSSLVCNLNSRNLNTSARLYQTSLKVMPSYSHYCLLSVRRPPVTLNL